MEQSGLDKLAIPLLSILKNNPYQNPPEYEKLKGKYQGLYSRRINKQHRLVYEVLPNGEGLKDANANLYEGIVKILRM